MGCRNGGREVCRAAEANEALAAINRAAINRQPRYQRAAVANVLYFETGVSTAKSMALLWRCVSEMLGRGGAGARYMHQES